MLCSRQSCRACYRHDARIQVDAVRVDVLVETLMVHPSLAESLQDAAD